MNCKFGALVGGQKFTGRDWGDDVMVKLAEDNPNGNAVNLNTGYLCGFPDSVQVVLHVEPQPINTDDYRRAPGGEGPHADTWKDKPHRLIYDLCAEIERRRSFANQ